MVYWYIRALPGEDMAGAQRQLRATAAAGPHRSCVEANGEGAEGRSVLTRLLDGAGAADLVVMTVGDLSAVLLDVAREQHRAGRDGRGRKTLSPYEEREVRRRLEADATSLRELGQEFGISIATVGHIRDGKHGHSSE